MDKLFSLAFLAACCCEHGNELLFHKMGLFSSLSEKLLASQERLLPVAHEWLSDH
jgi:hypothetical protein